MLNGKTVLITGGTGSFGKSFSKFLLKNYHLKKLIIFSRDECKQFKMKTSLNRNNVRFFIGDVRDLERLERAFNGVDIVIHAAALKHVPLLEYNPFEAVKTNVIGTQNVINAAINKKVDQVILISTDKACQPVNLYGSTKLCAEKLFINGNSYSGGTTRFSAVRYGNVLGSRGSIIETLLQKKPSDEVSITDENMTRFWITLYQSFQLVIFALANMQGGEIFIPKIKSMKLVDLFETIMPHNPKKITGIRPGEKLHEILIHKEEARHCIELKNYYVILPEFEEIFDIQNKFSSIIAQGQKLSPNFSYCSNSNPARLTPSELEKILKIYFPKYYKSQA